MPQSGAGCSQAVLDAAHLLSDLSEGLSKGGDAFIYTGAAVAVGSALTAATGVGAPVGVAGEIGAGTLLSFGLGAKLLGGAGKWLGDSVAAIQTGNDSGFMAAQGSAVFGLVPGRGGLLGDALQDAVAGAAGSSLGSSSSPRSCPASGR